MYHLSKKVVGSLACLLLGVVTPAAAACKPWIASSSDAADLIVGDISIRSVDVFDPQAQGENLAIHRLANQLHIQTRESVIAAQLLFASGDAFDVRKLQETARNLRANRYLRSATVTATQICDSTVDVLVQTGDNWSLIPGFNFSRAGGENSYSFKLSEINLLGFGKSLDLQLEFNPDRDQRVLQFVDPQLFGTRNQLTLQLQDNTDGDVRLLSVERPFYQLDARRAWSLSASDVTFIQRLYQDGFVSDQLAVATTRADANVGFSNGFNAGKVWRTRFGWRFERTRLAATTLFPESSPQAERLFSYPYIQLSYRQPQFIELSNLDVMGSVEDIDTGRSANVRIGIATELAGSSEDAIPYSAIFRQGFRPDKRLLALMSMQLSGFQTNGSALNTIASLNARAFVFQSRKASLFVAGNVVIGNELFAERQVVLGGETGLRGYPRRFQSGDRRARLTVEQRYFFPWYPLRAARIGAALFADTGSAWSSDTEPQLLSDVGAGLRIVGTRQADAKVMHIDLAFPLNVTGDIEKFQLVVSAKTRF